MIYDGRYLGSQFHDLRFLINGRYIFCGENSKKSVQKATSCIVKLKGIECKALNTTLLRHTLFNIKQVGRILSFNNTAVSEKPHPVRGLLNLMTRW